MLLEVVTPVPATGFFTLAWLLIAIPLASATVLLLVGKAGDRWGHLLGTVAPLASFAIGVCYFVQLLGVDSEGVAHLRLEGSCDGCASSSLTVKSAIEDASASSMDAARSTTL